MDELDKGKIGEILLRSKAVKTRWQKNYSDMVSVDPTTTPATEGAVDSRKIPAQTGYGTASKDGETPDSSASAGQRPSDKPKGEITFEVIGEDDSDSSDDDDDIQVMETNLTGVLIMLRKYLKNISVTVLAPTVTISTRS